MSIASCNKLSFAKFRSHTRHDWLQWFLCYQGYKLYVVFKRIIMRYKCIYITLNRAACEYERRV